MEKSRESVSISLISVQKRRVKVSSFASIPAVTETTLSRVLFKFDMDDLSPVSFSALQVSMESFTGAS